MADDAAQTVPSPWTLDGSGYLLTPSGAKAARLTDCGILMLYDKREHVEIPFTLADFVACQTQTQQGDG